MPELDLDTSPDTRHTGFQSSGCLTADIGERYPGESAAAPKVGLDYCELGVPMNQEQNRSLVFASQWNLYTEMRLQQSLDQF